MYRAGALAVMVAMLVAACAGGEMTTRPTTASAPGIVALVGGRVQPAPDAPVLADGVVLIERGLITAVGARNDVRVPAGARVLEVSRDGFP